MAVSAIGQMGTEKFQGAKNVPGNTKHTVRYIAKCAAAIGEITGDEQLLAIGEGLGRSLPAEPPSEPPMASPPTEPPMQQPPTEPAVA